MILRYAPRVLGIAYALFLSLFALDALDTVNNSAPVWLGLAVHLVPSVVVLAAVAIGWRYRLAGAFAFIAFALLYLSEGVRAWQACLLIAGPALLVGILFLADWIAEKSASA